MVTTFGGIDYHTIIMLLCIVVQASDDRQLANDAPNDIPRNQECGHQTFGQTSGRTSDDSGTDTNGK